MFVIMNFDAVTFAANPRFVMEMPNKNIHKKGFFPEPPRGRDLSKERILLHCCCAPCSTAIIEWMVGEGLRPGIFFSNSNIVPIREYSIRRDELIRYAAAHGLEMIDDEYDHSAWLAFVRQLETSPAAEPVVRQISPTIEAATSDGALSFRQAQGPVIRIAEMPERGPRCLECFKFRLMRAARYAATHGYTLLTTTLASSRWKDLNQVDAAGRWACETINSSLVAPGNNLMPKPCPDAVSDNDQASAGRCQTFSVLWWNQNWRRGGLQERRNALIKEWDMYNQTFCGCEFSQRH